MGGFFSFSLRRILLMMEKKFLRFDAIINYLLLIWVLFYLKIHIIKMHCCFIEGLLISNKSYKMKQLQFVMKMKLKYRSK